MFLENIVSSIGHSTNKRPSVLNSPIGKITVGNNDQNISNLHLMFQSNNKNNSPNNMLFSVKNNTDKL